MRNSLFVDFFQIRIGHSDSRARGDQEDLPVRASDFLPADSEGDQDLDQIQAWECKFSIFI